MSDIPTIIAFSAGGEAYHKTARRLRQQCREFGYDEEIEVDVDLTTHHLDRLSGVPLKYWIFRYIPSFILRKLDELDRDVLYLHGDFEIKQEIPEEAFDTELDIGLQKRWQYAVERSRFPMLAAPICARNNQSARRFLKVWQAHCLYVHDGQKTEHAYLLYMWKYFREHDESLKIDFFDPHIASLQFDADAPIVGHKSD